MRKVFIAPLTVISIFIGIISLWICLLHGYRMIAHPVFELEALAGQDIVDGRYVQGTISSCVTRPMSNNPHVRLGNDAGYIVGSKVYESYTIPILDDQYIRVLIYEDEAKKTMERIVQGEAVELSFAGQFKKGNEPNIEWYSQVPDFDPDKVVADYAIWQKSPDTERNYCLAGFYGLVIAALVFYASGGIHTKQIEPEKNRLRPMTPNYDLENELAVTGKRLERYKELERQNLKKGLWGFLCVLAGCYIDFVLDVRELKMLGLIILILGVKKCWHAFINSKAKCAMRIATMFSIDSIQLKKQEEERKAAMLEKGKLQTSKK